MNSGRESNVMGHWVTLREWAGKTALAMVLAAGALLDRPAEADETFNYQGKLMEAGQPADGLFDFEFRLCFQEVGGPALQTSQGSFIVTEGLVIADISFLDGTFNGTPYWLEIGVRPDGSPDPYDTLLPRQPILPAPYAIRALNDSSGWTSDGFNTVFDGVGTVAIGGPPSLTAKVEILSHFNNGLLVSQNVNSSNIVTGIQAFSINNGTGSTVAIEGITIGNGTGVRGISNFAGGTGVYGSTTEGIAVRGESFGPSGYAGYFQGGKNYFGSPVGMGTLTPLTPLHIEGGTANSLISGAGYGMFGPANGPNLIVDSAGLQRRNNGAAAQLNLNRLGGNIIVGDANAPVNIGNGTIFPNARIEVRSEDATDLMRLTSGPNAGDMILKVTADGYVGVGTNAPTKPLHVAGQSYFEDRVGIGTESPSVNLQVDGSFLQAARIYNTFASTGANTGLYVESDNPDTGIARAIEARTSGDLDTSIFARSDGASGRGMDGVSFGPGGTGVRGHAADPTGVNYGIRGSTSSSSGYAGYFTGGRNYFEGNVGIGNTTPNSLFEVREDDALIGAFIENTFEGGIAIECVGPFSGIGVIGVGEGDGGAAVVGTAFDGAVAGLFDAPEGGFAGLFSGDVDIAGRFDVSRNISHPMTWSGHVARLENTSSSTDGDILALKSNQADGLPGNNVNFVTFFNKDNSSIGGIKGDFQGGVFFSSGGADYAEWLPKTDPSEQLMPGDVVGVVDGGISRRTDRAQQVMVISTQPIVVGNRPIEAEDGAIDDWEKVAFIGQAPVKVRGPVNTGDFIIPSGRNDGVAIAVSPHSIQSSMLDRIIGTAWESSASDGVELITCAIGIGELPAAARAMDSMRQSMERQQETIDDLLNRVRSLEHLIGSTQ